MSKQILVNANAYEIRVAVLENGQINQLHIERKEDRNVVGNIYKGIVKRVLPGMQAAFLELGLERTAFLYVDDIIESPLGTDVEMLDEGSAAVDDQDYDEDYDDEDDYEDDEEFDELEQETLEEANEKSGSSKERRPSDRDRGPSRKSAPDRDDEESEDDNIGNRKEPQGRSPRGRGRGGDSKRTSKSTGGRGRSTKPSGRGRRAERRNNQKGGGRGRGGSNRGPGGRGGRRGGSGGRRGGRPKRNVNIQDVLKEGQEILVQVAKAPIGTKGARLTTHISLPGRNVVVLPTFKHIGISRRIENERERRRLRDLFSKKMRDHNVGFIVRTVAEGKQVRDLKADTDYLLKLWENIQEDSKSKKAPCLIHDDLKLSLRAVRDFLMDDVDQFIVDDKKEFELVLDFISQFMPRLKNRVKHFKGPKPLFEHFGIEAEISRALGKKVWLKSGGYLMVDQGEALTSIDVNTGRYVGSKSLEETILKTNLEAVKEIAYQLRLRNVGGIIIIDLIDMEMSENREKVFKALQVALAEDKAKTNILKISDLGLLEMTRKRTHEDLVAYLTDDCKYCDGRGYVKSRRTICYEIFREIEKEAQGNCNKIVVFAHPMVVNMIHKEELDSLEGLEERLNKSVYVKADTEFHQEQFEVYGKR